MFFTYMPAFLIGIIYIFFLWLFLKVMFAITSMATALKNIDEKLENIDENFARYLNTIVNHPMPK